MPVVQLCYEKLERTHCGAKHRYTYHSLVAIETSPRSIDRSFHQLLVRSAARNNAHYREIRLFIDIVIPHKKTHLPRLQPHEIRIFLVSFFLLPLFIPVKRTANKRTYIWRSKRFYDYTFQGTRINKIIYANIGIDKIFKLDSIFILVFLTVNNNINCFFFHQH